MNNHYTKYAKNSQCENVDRSKNIEENIFQTNSLFTYWQQLRTQWQLRWPSHLLPAHSHFPSNIQNIFTFCYQMSMEHYEHHVFINFNLALNYQIPIPPCQAHLDVISANRPQAKTTCSTYIYYLSYRDILLLDRHKTPHTSAFTEACLSLQGKKGAFSAVFFSCGTTGKQISRFMLSINENFVKNCTPLSLQTC